MGMSVDSVELAGQIGGAGYMETCTRVILECGTASNGNQIDPYNEVGFVVYDNVDSWESGSFVALPCTQNGGRCSLPDNVDVTTLGTYAATYGYTDAAENVAKTVTRGIKVVDRSLPTITLLGDHTI